MGMLDGKRAVVFGGSSGIGLAGAEALAGAGATVTICGRSPERLAAAAGGKGLATAAVDAADEAAVAAFFGRHGTVDALVVSIAGGAASGPFRDIGLDAWRRALEGKVFPYLAVLRNAIPHMAKDGSITLVTGAAARTPTAGGAGRGLTNAALDSLVGTLAIELAPVRVNAVSPGLIATPYWDNYMQPAAREAMYEAAAKRLPVGRVGAPEHVGQAILHMATNPFTTATILPCDGGSPVA